QPIVEPGASRVNRGKQRRARHSEQRHRLREPVDRGPPRLLEKQQNGGNQRSRMTDPDPPDEVRDLERPSDRNVVPPDPDSLDDEIGQRDEQQQREQERDAEAEIPAERRPAGENDRADLVGDRTERVAGSQDRRNASADDGLVGVFDWSETIGHRQSVDTETQRTQRRRNNHRGTETQRTFWTYKSKPLCLRASVVMSLCDL